MKMRFRLYVGWKGKLSRRQSALGLRDKSGETYQKEQGGEQKKSVQIQEQYMVLLEKLTSSLNPSVISHDRLQLRYFDSRFELDLERQRMRPHSVSKRQYVEGRRRKFGYLECPKMERRV